MKNNLPLILAVAFFSYIAIFDLIALSLGLENVAMYIKPSLVPSLALAAAMYFRTHNAPRKLVTLLFIALAFHTAGDTILEFGNFFIGAGAFLIGHLFYLAIIMKFVNAYEGIKRAWFFVPSLVIVPLLVKGLLGLEFPMSTIISVYAYTLMMIPLCALAGWLKKEPYAPAIFTGGILFFTSDTLLGLNIFSGVNFAMRHTIVMGTYLGAQALLVYGIARNITKSENNI